MPDLSDMLARGAAAGDVLGGGVPADAEVPELPGAGGGASEQIEAGIGMIESALGGLPGELAEKARSALNAIRDIAVEANAAAGAAPAPDEGLPTDVEPGMPV